MIQPISGQPDAQIKESLAWHSAFEAELLHMPRYVQEGEKAFKVKVSKGY